jgi:hypothetical protein
MWGEVYVVVEVVGDRDCEIERGGPSWPSKLKTEPHGLGFGLGCVNPKGGGCLGYVGYGIRRR